MMTVPFVASTDLRAMSPFAVIVSPAGAERLRLGLAFTSSRTMSLPAVTLTAPLSAPPLKELTMSKGWRKVPTPPAASSVTSAP